MKRSASDLRYLNPTLGPADIHEIAPAPRKDKMVRRKGAGPVSSKCPGCGTVHSRAVLEEHLYVCPGCKHHLSMPSQARIATLADEGTFVELDRNLVSVDPLEFADLRSYRARLQEARRETGVREAVTTGVCKIGGQQAVLIVFDFAFLGGTMGSVVGEKIAHAFEEATQRRIPLVSVAASGGARVQEGMFSLMQMAKVAAAASVHDRNGLAFVSVLTDPTFGGVTASFASLGDVLIAEPGAQIGFVGPRVIEQTTGVAPPKDSHRAETLLQAGLIDLVVKRADLPSVIAYLISHLKKQRSTDTEAEGLPPAVKRQRLPAWQKVGLARHSGRPSARYYIARMATRFLELHGDRWSADDPAIVGGLAELNGQTVIIIGHDRGGTPEEKAASHDGKAYSEGYRKSLRLMRLASKFRIPVVTLVDCPNAQANYESEHRGIAHALARNLATMANLPTPIVSVIIGEGGSGGALALGVADRVLMLENAIYSVISPEGAAAILYRDAGRAETVSEVLKLTAQDLHSLGIIDTVVPEPEGGAHLDPGATADTLKSHVLAALRAFSDIPTLQLLDDRYKKYRHIGQGGKFWREKVRSGLSDVFGLLAYAVSRMEKSNRKKPKVHESAPRTRPEKSRLPAASSPRRAERD
jgi:acetyl-CoA carboxylase carboxyl transferase beta subunit/acetyl-CoA carboxylase carboxyl transferase alpha subunit